MKPTSPICAAALALAAAAQAAPVVRIHADAPRHAINPAIYGINIIAAGKAGYLAADSAGLGSDRIGGNRMTGYNWENNFSSAGSDWIHSSDAHLMNNPVPTAVGPGGSITSFVDRNRALGRAPIVQLQMAGYVAADGNGAVAEAEKAPSARWAKAAFAKNAPFAAQPSTTDGVVYMDELVNLLVTKYGRADQGGVPYYALDNEPGLWTHTHPRIHPEPLTVDELLDRSEALSKAVKAVDPSARILGFESWGAAEMKDFTSATGFDAYKTRYDWAIAAFLGEMKKRSEAAGKRLVDVLAYHWYPEAKGDQRICATSEAGSAADIEARLQAPRSLWDPNYIENSWLIGLMGNRPLEIISRVQRSIDTTWPGTRMAITEYSYGGENHWSGGLATADVLGAFGKYDIEAANLHADFRGWFATAFRLFRNFDGRRNAFGDIHVAADNPDSTVFSTYASLDSKNPKLLHIIAINKSAQAKPVSFALAGKEWKSAIAYGFSTDSVIARLADPQGVTATGFDYTLPARSALHFVVSTDAQVVLPQIDLVSLQVEVIGQGRVSRSVQTALVPKGSTVTLTAHAAEGWTFAGWSPAVGADTTVSVVMDSARTIRAVFTSSANIVQNGDFSNGTANWTPSAWSPDGAAKGSASVKNGVLEYLIVNGATETWNAQVFQTGVPFVKGVRYELAFDAWADAPRAIQTYANSGALNETVALGTASKPFKYTFVAGTTESGKISFDLGGPGTNGSTVYLDNVSIKAISTSIAIQPAAGSARRGALLQIGAQLVARGEGEFVLRDIQGRLLARRQVVGLAEIPLAGLPRGLHVATFRGETLKVRSLD